MLQEIFAEVVDKNARVADHGKILDPQGRVIKDYSDTGLPAYLEFEVPIGRRVLHAGGQRHPHPSGPFRPRPRAGLGDERGPAPAPAPPSSPPSPALTAKPVEEVKRQEPTPAASKPEAGPAEPETGDINFESDKDQALDIDLRPADEEEKKGF